MSPGLRDERRRVRWFFAGLLVISAVIDIVGALLEHHLARSQVLETLLPAEVTVGGRTGAVLSGLALLLLAGGPAAYSALTGRAEWCLGTLPVVSYARVIVGLIQLLRPVIAPRAAAADRQRVHRLLNSFGRNYISHLAVHGASSYHWSGFDH